MLRKTRSDQGGAVLVVTLIIVMLMMVLVSDAAMIARVELEATRNADLDLRLEYACKGGYQIAETYLRQDQIDAPDVDSLLEEWSSGPIQRTLDPAELGGDPFYSDSASSYSEGENPEAIELEIWIEDEESKWPLGLLKVNNEATQRNRLEGLVNVLDAYREDTNYDLGPAEASQYAELIYAYVSRKEGEFGSFGPTPRPLSKSGSILKVTDLALIPGLPPEVVYDQYDANSDAVVPGLTRVLSPWSDLAININTAPLSVLRGLFRNDPLEASRADDLFNKRNEDSVELGEDLRMQRERERAGENLSPGLGAEGEEVSSGVFNSVDDLPQLGPTMTSRIFNEARSRMRVNSTTFTVWVTARIQQAKKTRRWVVRRDGARYTLVLTEEVLYPFYREKSAEEATEGDFFR